MSKESAIFGLGLGAGVMAIWALVELWPIIAIGAAGYIILKGISEDSKTKET